MMLCSFEKGFFMVKYLDLSIRIKVQIQSGREKTKSIDYGRNKFSVAGFKINYLDRKIKKGLIKKNIERRKLLRQNEGLRKKDRADVERLNQKMGHFEALKDEVERNDFFGKLNFRLLFLLSHLKSSGALSDADFKTKNSEQLMQALYDMRHQMTIVVGGQRRKLWPQEKLVLKMATQLSSHHIPAVKLGWQKMAKSLEKQLKEVDLNKKIIMADLAGKKPQMPQGLTKKEQSTWQKYYGTYQKLPTLYKVGVLAAGAATVGLGIWLMKKMWGAKKTVKSASSKQNSGASRAANSNNKKGFFGNLWSKAKWFFGISAALFTVGASLDRRKIYGVLGRFIKRNFGKDVEKHWFTKGWILLTRFDLQGALMTFTKGIDKKEHLHRTMARKLDMSGKHNLLWYLGDVKFSDFQNHDYKKSKRALAFGKLAALPLVGAFLNKASLIDGENRFQKNLNVMLKKTGVIPVANDTVDDVLAKLNKKIAEGGRFDDSVNKRLTIKQQRRDYLDWKKDKGRSDRFSSIAALAISKGVLTVKEKKELLNSSRELGRDLTEIKKALPTCWEVFKDELTKLTFGLGPFKPSHGSKKEDTDLIQARKLLVNKMVEEGGKSEAKFFGKMSDDVREFQVLLTKVKPGISIKPSDLVRLKVLRKKIFGNGRKPGYFAKIKDALRNANRITTARYNRRMLQKKPNVTVNGLMSLAYAGVGVTFNFVVGKNMRGEYEFSMRLIIPVGVGVGLKNVFVGSREYIATDRYTGKSYVKRSGAIKRFFGGMTSVVTRPLEIGSWLIRKARGGKTVIEATSMPAGHSQVFNIGSKGGGAPKAAAPSGSPIASHSIAPDSIAPRLIKNTKNGAWYQYNGGRFHLSSAEMKNAKSVKRACRLKYMQTLKVTNIKSFRGKTYYRVNNKWVVGPDKFKTAGDLAKVRGEYMRYLKAQGIDYAGKAVGAQGALKYFQFLKNALGPATAAVMIYQLESAQDKRKALAKTAISLGLIFGGMKSTDKVIGMLMPNTPGGQVTRGIVAFLGGFAAAFGFTGTVYDLVKPYIPEFYGDKQFYSRLARMTTTVIAAKQLRSLSRKLTGEMITRSIARNGARKLGSGLTAKFSQTVGRQISKFASKTMLKKIATTMGWKGGVLAFTAGNSAAGFVLDDFIAVGLGAWMAKDIYDLAKISARAYKLNKAMKERSKLQVERVEFLDLRSKKAFLNHMRINGGYRESLSLGQIMERATTVEVVIAISQLADVNVRIYRDGIKGHEEYRMVKGQIRAMKVVDLTGKVVASVSDKELSQKITFPAPYDFKKWHIDFDKLPDQKLKANMRVAINLMKDKCGWTRLDHKIISRDKVEIIRLESKERINIVRKGKFWNFEGANVNLQLDFFQAVALANLRNAVKVILQKGKYNPGSRRPFSVSGEAVLYDKSYSVFDLDILKKGEWSNFYRRIGITPDMIAETLNSTIKSV